MSFKCDMETKVSISLKDFRNRNEAFVREEFLVPLFRSAGYDAVGTGEVLRQVNLAKRTPTSDGRRYIFPDFVLAKNGIALWVVDAKAPSVRLGAPKNIEQIQSYCEKVQCPNAILSNAVDTFVYHLANGKLLEVDRYSKDEICGRRWDEFLELLSADGTVSRVLSFEDALRIYQTDEYVDRSFVMNVLQLYPFSAMRRLLGDPNSFVFRSRRFRDRALAALLDIPHAHVDPALFSRITSTSLNDPERVVRENLITCLISHRQAFNEHQLPQEIYSMTTSTPLEEIVFLSFLGTTARGRHVLDAYKPAFAWLRDYIACLQRNPPISFPLALPLRKPKSLSFAQYSDYLCSLPSIVERVSADPRTHSETIKVLESCLSYCAARDHEVYSYLSNRATTHQRAVFSFLSRRKSAFEDTAQQTRLYGFSRIHSLVGQSIRQTDS